MKHTITQTWGAPGSASNISLIRTVEAEAEINIDAAIIANQTNKAVAFALDVSQAKLFLITSDKNCTVKTNSSGSPDNTFTLLADVPYLWTLGGGTLQDTAGVDLADITSLFVTNTTACVVKLRALFDPTV